MLHSAVEAFFELLWSLEQNVITILVILLKVVPLVAILSSTSQKIEGTIPLGIMVVEAKEATLLLLKLLSRRRCACVASQLLSEEGWSLLLDLGAHVTKNLAQIWTCGGEGIYPFIYA